MSGCLLRTLWITAFAVFLATACGDDAVDDGADAGVELGAQLVILDPPGDAIGLPFGADAALRIRYETDDGEPIAGAAIEFGFAIAPTEATGGAALSDTMATTDNSGIARIDVVAGAERANFRVRASAERAQPATFYVAVSDAGFTDLIVQPTHGGWRQEEDFARVQLRLFRRVNVRCADIDIDDAPESVFPPRTMAGFGGTSTFQNLSALEPYTLLAWAEVEPDGVKVAFGCTTLGAAQVQPGPSIRIQAPIADRPLELPAKAELWSTIDLTPVADAVRAAGATRAWDVLRCPAGPGQLLLDCALDAAATTDGDATDCVLDATAALDPLALDIETQRGAVDLDGCRPASGLDQVITDAIAGGGIWPPGAALAQLLEVREQVTASLTLGSQIETVSAGIARHTLTLARFDAGTGTHSIALLSTARPVLAQHQVPITVADGTTMHVAEHGFTLRIGSASHAAFLALGLEPLGLGDRASDLGAALADSVDDAGDTGCSAFSALACGAASKPSACLATACAEAAANLDVRFDDGWRAADGVDLDFSLAGTAPLYDFDDDLQIDSVGADNGGNPGGTWTVSLELADGTEVPTTGSFGAAGPE